MFNEKDVCKNLDLEVLLCVEFHDVLFSTVNFEIENSFNLVIQIFKLERLYLSKISFAIVNCILKLKQKKFDKRYFKISNISENMNIKSSRQLSLKNKKQTLLSDLPFRNSWKA